MTASPLSSVPALSGEEESKVAQAMRDVETRLREVVDHDDPFIRGASTHLMQAGGKRFRPLLTVLCSLCGTGPNHAVIDAAVAVELTHLASLYHDDVMDEAPLRRGVPSANAEYSNSVAILVGDLLFGRASALVAALGPEAVRIQADTFVRLCTGQIHEGRMPAPGVDVLDHHLRVLADKTGVLIATAARYGAMFAGCDDATVESLRTYGEQVGLAFQLADDVLDICAASAESGKTPGTDIMEGVDTLPVLLVKHRYSASSEELIRDIDRVPRHPDLLPAVLDALRTHPALNDAREYSRLAVAEAKRAISALDGTPIHTVLCGVADSAIERAV